ncbi:MAG: thioredoxin family protein [Pseudomonadota bacterium]
MKKIVVYGPGCAKCHQAEEVVRRVVAESGAEAEVVKVSDFGQMAKAGILSTPAVAIDGVVKLSGRVPTPDQIKGWLAE